jgi:hypothetical protein
MPEATHDADGTLPGLGLPKPDPPMNPAQWKCWTPPPSTR